MTSSFFQNISSCFISSLVTHAYLRPAASQALFSVFCRGELNLIFIAVLSNGLSTYAYLGLGIIYLWGRGHLDVGANCFIVPASSSHLFSKGKGKNKYCSIKCVGEVGQIFWPHRGVECRVSQIAVHLGQQQQKTSVGTSRQYSQLFPYLLMGLTHFPAFDPQSILSLSALPGL